MIYNTKANPSPITNINVWNDGEFILSANEFYDFNTSKLIHNETDNIWIDDMPTLFVRNITTNIEEEKFIDLDQSYIYGQDIIGDEYNIYYHPAVANLGIFRINITIDENAKLNYIEFQSSATWDFNPSDFTPSNIMVRLKNQSETIHVNSLGNCLYNTNDLVSSDWSILNTDPLDGTILKFPLNEVEVMSGEYIFEIDCTAQTFLTDQKFIVSAYVSNTNSNTSYSYYDNYYIYDPLNTRYYDLDTYNMYMKLNYNKIVDLNDINLRLEIFDANRTFHNNPIVLPITNNNEVINAIPDVRFSDFQINYLMDYNVFFTIDYIFETNNIFDSLVTYQFKYNQTEDDFDVKIPKEEYFWYFYIKIIFCLIIFELISY
jgi:hypothetical protein